MYLTVYTIRNDTFCDVKSDQSVPACGCTQHATFRSRFGIPANMKAAFLCVALVAVVLVTAPMAAQSATSVFVMRHCARTTPNTLDGGDPQYTYYNNYTAINWPEWPNNLPAYQCLPNGLTIVQGSGKWLAANKIPTVRSAHAAREVGLARLAAYHRFSCHQPIAITADAVARDLETSASLVDGLGISQDAVTVNHAPFGDACPSFNDTFKDAAISGACACVCLCDCMLGDRCLNVWRAHNSPLEAVPAWPVVQQGAGTAAKRSRQGRRTSAGGHPERGGRRLL